MLQIKAYIIGSNLKQYIKEIEGRKNLRIMKIKLRSVEPLLEITGFYKRKSGVSVDNLTVSLVDQGVLTSEWNNQLNINIHDFYKKLEITSFFV